MFSELYPGHGYGIPEIGFAETVGEFKREQLLNIHEEQLRPASWIISIVGAVETTETLRLLEQLFGGLVSPAGAFPDLIYPNPSKNGSFTIHKEGEQACLAIGFGAPSITDPNYISARVLNAILGEGMSSRIFSELREERGLAYATGSSYSARMLGGQLFGYIGTKPESLEEAKTEMLNIFQKICDEEVGEEELNRTKQFLIGRFLIDHQTNFKRAFYPGYFEATGLGYEWDSRYPDEIAKVTAKQVHSIANTILAEPVIVELKV